MDEQKCKAHKLALHIIKNTGIHLKNGHVAAPLLISDDPGRRQTLIAQRQEANSITQYIDILTLTELMLVATLEDIRAKTAASFYGKPN